MGRFLGIGLAGLLALATAAPVAAGANVSNQSGSFEEAYGSWGSVDEATGTETHGEFFVVQVGDEGYVEYLVEESGNYIGCEGGEPGTEDTGDYAFVGTRTYGWGNTSLDLGRRLSVGTAVGEMYLETASVDECQGVWDIIESGEAPLTLSLTGAGDLVSFKSSESVKIPGDFNAHSSYRGVRRAATGTIDFGLGSRTLNDAEMAHVSWSDHCNGSNCGY